MTLLSAALLLFLVMDPVGNVPLFISALKQVPPERQNKVLIRELLIALFLLVFFLLLGQSLLHSLHITDPALTISGGVVLFLIALRMVFPTAEGNSYESVDSEPFIVPLAMPYMVGPSAIATVVLLMSREPERWPAWTAAVVLSWFACSTIILLASRFKRYLSDKILLAMERLMGMLLVTLSVQMLLSGLQKFIQTLH
jgi:multiple antibiotic resistance protein